MSTEPHIRRLLEACREQLDAEDVQSVVHLLEHGEPEMAFEGLVLDLIAADAYPENFQFAEWDALAKDLGLNKEAVFDGDFWSKFTKWGQKAGR